MIGQYGWSLAKPVPGLTEILRIHAPLTSSSRVLHAASREVGGLRLMRVGSEPRLPSEIGDPLVSDGGRRGDTALRAAASAAQPLGGTRRKQRTGTPRRGQAPGREIDRRDLDLDSGRNAPAHSKGCLLEPGRLFDQLAMEADSQTARATAEPRISTVATYRAYSSSPQTMRSTSLSLLSAHAGRSPAVPTCLSGAGLSAAPRSCCRSLQGAARRTSPSSTARPA